MKENDLEVNSKVSGACFWLATSAAPRHSSDCSIRRPARPRPIVVRAFTTLEFPDLAAMIETFMRTDAGGQGARSRRGVLRRRGSGDRRYRDSSPTCRGVSMREQVARAVRHRAASRILNDLAGDGVRGAGAAGVRAARAAGRASRCAAATWRSSRPAPAWAKRCCTTSTAASSRRPPKAGTPTSPPRNERDIDVLRDLIERFGRAEVEARRCRARGW